MVYQLMGKLMPQALVKRYKELLNYAHIEVDEYKFLGFIMLGVLGVALVIALDLAALFDFPLFLTFFLSFFVMHIAIYLWLLLKADAKALFVERSLPDALQLMASNLKAGLTVDKALFLSSRPEFGPLKDELDKVGKEVTVGKRLPDALIGMTKRIKSEKLNKTVSLIITGIKSGGQLAPLLEQTSKNLRSQELVEAKVKSSVKMYVIFIFVAVCFGAPVLFGLSSLLVSVLKLSLQDIDVPATVGVSTPLSIHQVTISEDFIIFFIVISLITTSILGSLILGLISTGKEKDGVKYIPFIIAATLLVFFIVRILIRSLLGGFFVF